MASNYYYRTYGQIFMHEKPNLCPVCKHRQEHGDWEGYCPIKNKILSAPTHKNVKGRCADFEKLELEEGFMRGRRHDLLAGRYDLAPGEYGKRADGKWFCHVPAQGFYVGGLGKHTVTVNEDRTITVSPSIVCTGEDGKSWHGYLEKGIWREV